MPLRDRIFDAGRRAASVALERASEFVAPEPEFDPLPQEIAKAEGDGMPTDAPTEDPSALFFDPYILIQQMGYKDKPTMMSYGMLAAIVTRIPIVRAIIQTRLSQVSAFARPPQDIHQTGFKIRPKDKDAKLSPADRKFQQKMNELMLRSGVKVNGQRRDGFEHFIKKFFRDSAFYDQAAYEIVKNRRGLPAAWYAVDASTIRLSDNYKGFVETNPEAIRYVQVYNQVVINEWKDDEMAFMIRNPATNIWNQGYGEAEGEMLVKTMTQLLWSDEYNSRIFSQGTMVKGLVNIKGTVNQKLLRAFRREWLQMVSGVSNSWRTPILNTEEIQYIPLDKSNKDMEFSAYYDFLLKVACAVMLIDPSEVNFKFGNSGQQKSMFESGNKQKLVESKDKGLKPILRSVATSINDNIIEPIDPEWELIFYGLEAHTPAELADLNTKRGQTTHTVNELREEQGKEPDPHGDVILNQAYIQYKMAKEGMAAGGGEFPAGEQDQEAEAPSEEELASLLEAAEEEGDEEAAKSLAKSFKLDIAI